MYKVIMITGTGEQGKDILRQTPGGKGIPSCGKYQFYVNEIIPDPDFVIIRGKTLKKATTFHVAPENIILTTSEPYSVLSYPKKYCKQFGMVCSCQEQLKHHNIKYTPAILSWFVGLKFKDGKVIPHMSYDDFKQQDTPAKEKLISVVTSNKAFTQGHQERINFVEKLKQHYGDKLDVFGRGFNSFEDKWDVLAPYKYHIAIENSQSKYYWTEKLSDCYLTETFPIYYGCKNTEDYFPTDSFATIDIYDFEKSIETIDKLITSEQHFDESISTLKECKELVLEKYNIFNYLSMCLDNLNPDLPKKDIVIQPAKTMSDWHNIYLNVIGRNSFKIKKFFASLFKGKSVLDK